MWDPCLCRISSLCIVVISHLDCVCFIYAHEHTVCKLICVQKDEDRTSILQIYDRNLSLDVFCPVLLKLPELAWAQKRQKQNLHKTLISLLRAQIDEQLTAEECEQVFQLAEQFADSQWGAGTCLQLNPELKALFWADWSPQKHEDLPNWRPHSCWLRADYCKMIFTNWNDLNGSD